VCFRVSNGRTDKNDIAIAIETMSSQLRHLQNTLASLDRPETPPSFSKSLPTRKNYSSTRPRRPPLISLAGQFYLKHWSPILLTIELVLNLYFLHHGPLHPIDYPTYLVQARQFREGERDYANIYGPTGPLAYPGGHVIIFSIFERLFGIKGDQNWPGYRPAQWGFLALQLVHTFVPPEAQDRELMNRSFTGFTV
jgi:hypothetical protein